MKKSLLTFFFLLTAVVLLAQEKAVPVYGVYEIEGKVTLVEKTKKSPVETGLVVKESDVLNLAKGSVVHLVNLQSRVMVTLKGKRAGSVASLVRSKEASFKNMTEKYFAFVLNNLRGKGEKTSGKVAAIFRDESDSLLVCPAHDSLHTHIDTLNTKVYETRQ